MANFLFFIFNLIKVLDPTRSKQIRPTQNCELINSNKFWPKILDISAKKIETGRYKIIELAGISLFVFFFLVALYIPATFCFVRSLCGIHLFHLSSYILLLFLYQLFSLIMYLSFSFSA